MAVVVLVDIDLLYLEKTQVVIHQPNLLYLILDQIVIQLLLELVELVSVLEQHLVLVALVS